MRWLIYTETLICFGPLLLFWLWGALLLPTILGMTIQDFYYSSEPGIDLEGIWSAAQVILVIVLGGYGLVGIIRLLFLITGSSAYTSKPRKTLAFVAAGFLALFMFNFPATGSVLESFGGGDVGARLFVLILPFMATCHLLYLTRNSLFSNSSSTT